MRFSLTERKCISDHVNVTLPLKHAIELHGTAEDSFATILSNEMHFSVRQMVLKCSCNKIVNFPSWSDNEANVSSVSLSSVQMSAS